MSRRRAPSSWGAAIRSALVPGWGQLATNRPRAGRVFIFTTGMLAIVGLTVFLFVEPVEIAAWLADPDILLLVVIANLVFLVIRLVSTEMAWRDGGGHKWVVAAILALVVSIPHVALGWVGIETRATLRSVFAEPVAVAMELPPAPSTTAATTTTIPTTTTTAPIELSPITTLPGQFEDDLNVEKAPVWAPFGIERVNILLLGGDAGPGRGGLRTDTMMVASIDPTTGDAVLIGVPRNFAGITLIDGTPVPVTQLGHVYGWGARNAELFPGPDAGAAAVENTIENITGLEIDHYVLVDLTGFADVVDAFGGVRLDVAEPVDGPLYDVETGSYDMVQIPSGPQHLDGAHALAYARARYGSSDYVRMGRQRCILASMASQADLLTLFSRLGNLLEAVESNLVTNLPADLVPALIRLTPRVNAATTRMIGFDSTWGNGETIAGRAVPDISRIREAVRIMIESPGSAADIGAITADAGC